jgi:two-component system, OmpR family, sensor histidine kinase MprB
MTAATPPEPGKAAESGWFRLPDAYRFPYGTSASGLETDTGSAADRDVAANDQLAERGARDAETDKEKPGGSRVRTFRDAFGRLGLRARIGLLAALGVGLAVAATSAAAYLTVRTELHSSRDDNLFVRARSAVGSILSTPEQLARFPADALGAADVNLGLISADGQTYIARAGPGRVKAPPLGAPEQAVALGEARQSIRTASLNETEYRVVAVPAGPGLALVLAQPTAVTERVLDRLGLVLLIVGGLGIGVATTAGLAIARAGLRPVERLTAAAEHVASTERLEPIEVRGHDELARLATSFNAMLAALSRSRERQQQLVADAGHELRTPLTSLRTNLDLLVQTTSRGGLSDRDREELLADVRAQSEELTVLVQDLVELARDDPAAAQVEELDFAEICERAIDRVKRRAPGLTFDVKLAPWVVRGDATALERAVANILDNAAKWSPAGATVQVRLDGGELQVIDEGPGIPPADLPHVFERFYRATDARRLPGSGLGLAIVKQVADRHDGAVEAARAGTGGTQVTFRLPAATST